VLLPYTPTSHPFKKKRLPIARPFYTRPDVIVRSSI
jgi:hypothetical protein